MSGAYGGRTVDFRELAENGMMLVGRTQTYTQGRLTFAADLGGNIARGDANLHSLFDEADAYVARNGLDLPEEPEARRIRPAPDCMTSPILELDLAKAGISSIIWATGFTTDYSWLKFDLLDAKGRPKHKRGVSTEPGIYFLGLPWLSRRGSSSSGASGTTPNSSPTRSVFNAGISLTGPARAGEATTLIPIAQHATSTHWQ